MTKAANLTIIDEWRSPNRFKKLNLASFNIPEL